MNNDNPTERISFRGEVITKAPDGLFKGNHDLYGYATVEVQDRDGDMMKVDGCRLELFKKNGSVPLIGAAHRYSATPSGDYPTVGKVVAFARTTKRVGRKDVPALAFAAEMERGENGELTDYARKIKSKYDQKILTSFSVGGDVYKATPREGGRANVEDWDIYEVSCCLVPSNYEATVMRALKAEFGDEFDYAEVLMEAFNDRFSRLTKEITRRMDDLESAIVAASEGRRDRPATDDSRPQLDPSVREAITTLLAQLSQ